MTGLSLWFSIPVSGVVCTLYTCFGGLKAVVWTDVVQCIVMVVGFIAVISAGCSAQGGFTNVWETAEERGRIDFNQ